MSICRAPPFASLMCSFSELSSSLTFRESGMTCISDSSPWPAVLSRTSSFSDASAQGSSLHQRWHGVRHQLSEFAQHSGGGYWRPGMRTKVRGMTRSGRSIWQTTISSGRRSHAQGGVVLMPNQTSIFTPIHRDTCQSRFSERFDGSELSFSLPASNTAGTARHHSRRSRTRLPSFGRHHDPPVVQSSEIQREARLAPQTQPATEHQMVIAFTEPCCSLSQAKESTREQGITEYK